MNGLYIKEDLGEIKKSSKRRHKGGSHKIVLDLLLVYKSVETFSHWSNS